MARRRAAKTVDELLAQARATLPGRPSPAEALHAFHHLFSQWVGAAGGLAFAGVRWLATKALTP